MVVYNNLSDSKGAGCVLPLWDKEVARSGYRNYCVASVLIAFLVGLSIGIFVPLITLLQRSHENEVPSSSAAIENIFVSNSYGAKAQYPTVAFVESNNSALISDGIFWSDRVEEMVPKGFAGESNAAWAEQIENSVAVKLERGCGRMQNRLVIFEDGSRGCARYRQNTDQIQGEIFSFYLAQLLGIPNLAPSRISVVNPRNRLWKNIAQDLITSQWSTNRPVVLTKYIPDLDTSNIPKVLRPNERHLNRDDVQNLTLQDNKEILIELTQWSDLIIFDYLTANLDRIVNNLYNYQWNSDIMEAPAHNLAKKVDTNLLVFLDNESGLLHGYRLLEKYETYHSILLDNLCLFRRSTVEAVKRLRRDANVGDLLRDFFERDNSKKVKDVLPSLPDKSVKILNTRIEKVYSQIVKCESTFGTST